MNENQGRFTSLLKQEVTALQNLYGLLMKELVALKDRNLDSINELTEEKNMMLDKIEVLDRERQLYVEDNVTDTNEINTLSSEIKVCLDKCKQQNNINGGVIEMSQLFNEKILDIIYGNPDKQITYSATGKNNSINNQRSLARV
jgi:flagellar biosynthesis protein FlgN